VSCDLGGEAALLNLKSGVYFGLNPVGATIWKLLGEPRTIGYIRAAILENYAVEPEQCEQDLFQLLDELNQNGLIELIDTE
jgi:hypothetical protein